MKNKVQTRLNRSVVLILCFAMLLVLTGCGKNPVESETNMGSAEEVIAQLAQQSTAYGFDNALSELKEKSTIQIGSDSYIRLQQQYNGIPVYGKTIVCVANAQGELTSISGNVMDVSPDINLDPTITMDAVESAIRAYASDTLGREDDLSAAFIKEFRLCLKNLRN